MNTIRSFLSFLLDNVAWPLTLNEFSEWCPWLAERLARWSARRLGDVQASDRYEKEYLASLEAVPGKLSKLIVSLGYVINVPRMRRALREPRYEAKATERSTTQIPGFIGY
jgi:hypothetical protein